MGHPNIDEVTAREEAQPGKTTALLVVTGKAKTKKAAEFGVFQKAGGDPKTLQLNSTTPEGSSLKAFRFELEVEPGHYSKVQLYWKKALMTGGTKPVT